MTSKTDRPDDILQIDNVLIDNLWGTHGASKRKTGVLLVVKYSKRTYE
jgi:hypothetical protein